LSLNEDEWHLLAIGAFDRPTRICALSPELSVLIGVSTVSIWISPDYVKKIRFKHRTAEMAFSHIPTILKYGEAYTDREPNCIQFFSQIDNRLYRLVLKGVQLKNEIWVSTFHPVHASDYRRRTKRSRRIK